MRTELASRRIRGCYVEPGDGDGRSGTGDRRGGTNGAAAWGDGGGSRGSVRVGFAQGFCPGKNVRAQMGAGGRRAGANGAPGPGGTQQAWPSGVIRHGHRGRRELGNRTRAFGFPSGGVEVGLSLGIIGFVFATATLHVPVGLLFEAGRLPSPGRGASAGDVGLHLRGPRGSSLVTARSPGDRRIRFRLWGHRTVFGATGTSFGGHGTVSGRSDGRPGFFFLRRCSLLFGVGSRTTLSRGTPCRGARGKLKLVTPTRHHADVFWRHRWVANPP